MRTFSNFFSRFWKQILFAFLFVVYVTISVFSPLGIYWNNIVVPFLALGNTLVAFSLTRRVGGGKNLLLWWGFAIGWALWTISESWWSFVSLPGHELPFPSWVDTTWLLGYLPMYFALWLRIRSMPKITNSVRRIAVLSLSLVVFGLTLVFVINPIAQNNDPTAIVASALNIFYPLADLVLLLLALWALFSYEQGLYGAPWRWISAGFLFMTVSDLFFSYATTLNLYYPDGQANLISTLGVDVPYTLGYLFVFVGFLGMRSLIKSHLPPVQTQKSLTLVPDTHVLVFTDGNNRVIEVSRNYSRVFSEEFVPGRNLSDVIGLSPADNEVLARRIRSGKILGEQAIPAKTGYGILNVLTSGIVEVDSEEKISGANLLLRMLTQDNSLDTLLTDFEKGVLRHLLRTTGAKENQEKEVKQLLLDYYAAYFGAFYSRVFTEGGSFMADSFLSELQSAAKKNDWQVEYGGESLLDASALPLSELKKALPVLFETAKQFVVRVSDSESAGTIVQNVRSQFGDAALNNVSRFETVKEELT
jgi:hypothetical protein